MSLSENDSIKEVLFVTNAGAKLATVAASRMSELNDGSILETSKKNDLVIPAFKSLQHESARSWNVFQLTRC